MVKNQPNCLQKEAFTSEIQAVWVVFAGLVSQNRGFRFQRSGPTNEIKIAPWSLVEERHIRDESCISIQL